MAKIILTDTCYWLGLVDSEDQHHEDADTISSLLINHKIVLPWPCLYETICTRLVRKKKQLSLFEDLLKKASVEFVDDTEYKVKAMQEVFERNRNFDEATFSLVDSVIREMLSDINLKIDFLVTFNKRDFIDICQKRNIKLLPE